MDSNSISYIHHIKLTTLHTMVNYLSKKTPISDSTYCYKYPHPFLKYSSDIPDLLTGPADKLSIQGRCVHCVCAFFNNVGIYITLYNGIERHGLMVLEIISNLMIEHKI